MARKKTPVIQRALVVDCRRPAGEDPSIYECEVSHPWEAEQLKSGAIRLFDPAVDDRGPCVPFIATYGNKPSVWYPQTSGVYVVAFKAGENTDGWSLGFGVYSSPQRYKWQAAKALADYEKNKELKGRLRVLKVPCVFHADHPDAPGGSSVEVDVSGVVIPAKAELDRWYC